MPRVPAVCDSCGAFFPSPIEVTNSTDITFGGIGVGPCPRCGGTGHVPDGTYNFVGDTIELLSGPQRSRSELERLAAILRDAQKRGASVEQVRDEVRREVPELTSLADALPRTRNELYAFITLILAILALLLSEARRTGDTKIEVTQIFNLVTQTAPAPQAQKPARSSSKLKSKPPGSSKIGRNAPCPCGTGKKYKHCHLRQP